MSFVHHHAANAVPAATDACLVIQGDRLLARADASHSVQLPDWTTIAKYSEAHTAPLHLGTIDHVVHWTLAIEQADAPAPTGWAWHEIRALLSVFTPAQWHAVSCARQLLWWDKRHRFCGSCGTPTMVALEERARRCPSCNAVFYPVVSPAVIVAVTRGDALLLAHNRNFRPGVFSLLAGFVDPGETLEQAVLREVNEEVGIKVGNIAYIISQPWSFPNSLMIGFRAEYVSGEIAVDGKEIETASWFSRESLPELPRQGTVARTIIEQWRAAPKTPAAPPLDGAG